MRTFNHLCAGLACLAGLVGTDSLIAAPLAAATFDESAIGTCFGTETLEGVDDFSPELVNVDNSGSDCQAISNVFTSGIVIHPFINIELHADTSGSFTTADGFAAISYYMRINGPSDTFVPVRVKAAANIAGTVTGGVQTDGATSARGSAGVSGLPVGNISLCTWWVFEPSCSGPEGGASGSVDTVVDLYSGSQFYITMQANAHVQAAGGSPGSGYPPGLAEIDLVVDPQFEFVNPDDALLYSFEFSPNMTDVPAPGAAWLFATGLGLLGSRLRPRYC